ncbi:MAG: glycosyltransferase family 4 protein, partial [Phycisphaerae bacterium]
AHVRADLGFRPDCVEVIPNGLDFNRIDRAPAAARVDFGIDERVPLIVWAGRMDPVKNMETFVDVIGRVRESLDVRGLLLGDGVHRSSIETYVNNSGLHEVISMPGWSEAVAAWLKTADVLLLPSRTEGCPNVVLEAMACGCAVVASDAAGCAELIRPGETGEVYPADDVDGFARGVIRLLTEPDRRRRYLSGARASVIQGYGIQDVVDRWRSTYDRLMMNS